MTIGPLEIIVLGFDGNRFTGDIAAALEDAIDTGAIRVVDLVFARKDADGLVTVLELEDANDDYSAFFEGFDDLRDVLTDEDAMKVAEILPPDSSALLALIGHTWSTRIAEAIRAAGGRLLASQRINEEIMDELRDDLDELMTASSRRAA